MIDDFSLEESLKRLDEINRAMKAGGLTLERSLELYEEGAKLVALCYEKLDQTELKIQEISERTLKKAKTNGEF
ncbi:MAG: exodeoxyribonuclease VII small subunit [Oscillospiraceae bacterium]|jgi:exodeoxyribonuclease VII small subunit|nr:exodeoxyribonuclease VII small subunit [Oscillospiraceae bacterium]